MISLERAEKLFDDLESASACAEWQKRMMEISESFADEIRREQRNLFREVLETLQEAMIERRLYCDAWEWKYRERWDHEDALISAAIIGKEVV